MDIKDPFAHILSEKAEIIIDGVVHQLYGAEIFIKHGNVLVRTSQGEFDYALLANSAGNSGKYNANSLYTYQEMKEFLSTTEDGSIILNNNID